MNLALEKGERVTPGGKGRGETGEVTGVVANVHTMDSLGIRYGKFSGWGMTAGKVEVLLVVSGFEVDRGVKTLLVNKYVNIKESDMRGGDGSSKSDRVVTVEAFKEKEKGIVTMSPQQEDVINKPDPDLEPSEFRKSSSRDPMKRLA